MAGNIAANVTPAARRAEPAPVMSNAAGRTNTPATRILRGLKRVRNSSPNSRVPILELVRVLDGCTGISSVDDAPQAIDRQFGARMRRARRYHDTKAIPAAIAASPPEFVKGRSGAASAGKSELRLGSQINISTPSAVKPPPLKTNIRIINANPAPAATRNAQPRAAASSNAGGDASWTNARWAATSAAATETVRATPDTNRTLATGHSVEAR